MRDLVVVAHDGARLAVRDHRGDGPPIVLMHGAGTHLLSMERLARELAGYRIVTMDQRWSGQSSDSANFSWDDLVNDVESVAHALKLDNPVVGGHSWGGMIAVHYGVAHPEAPGVFNLDGHGPGNASLYDGVDQREFDELSRSMASPPRHLGAEGDDDWKNAALALMRKLNLEFGIPEEDVDAFGERAFLPLHDNRWRLHPSPQMYVGLTGDQKLLELYRRVAGPLLVVSSGGTDWGPPSAANLMAAYHRGLTAALAELTAEYSNVTVVHVPEATHVDLIRHHAPVVANSVRHFLDQAGYR